MADDDLSINQLAYEFGVHRATIWCALKDGALVPTGRKGNHLRFSREYVNRLKDSARAAGATGWAATALRRLQRRRIPVEDDPDRPRPVVPKSGKAERSTKEGAVELSVQQKAKAELSVKELAGELGVHQSTIRRDVIFLVEVGRGEREDDVGRERRRQFALARLDADASFLNIKQELL